MGWKEFKKTKWNEMSIMKRLLITLFILLVGGAILIALLMSWMNT